ncbi:MAG: UDP-N-acetylmuramoyl-L-alanine--D-glutamate ligase [Turneriella sp.]
MAERILLIGAAGKTGASYARLLLAHGKHVLWYDKNPAAAPEQLNSTKLTFVPSDRLDIARLRGQFDRITLTPGVPLSHPFILAARAENIPVVSEVAYCAPHLRDFKIIGITGTDGKSTTTTLVAQILRSLGVAAVECGNFGLPLSEIVLNQAAYRGKALVCELSSYQLEEPGDLALDAAIYLNLAPDHLNRYADIEGYGLAKWNILRLLRGNAPLIVSEALLPGHTSLWKNNHPIGKTKSPVLAVATENLRSPHFSVSGQSLLNQHGQAIADLSAGHLAGRHNFSNLLFALEAIRTVFTENVLANLASALTAVEPLPHRFERIPQAALAHITFINDSKATTTQAAMIALKNAANPVFIFLGGQGKGESYRELGEALRAKGARALIYGECRDDMAKDFTAVDFTQFTLHENLFKAFHTAKRMVHQQKLTAATLLLSPAATSWDQYKSFEERGDHFRELVRLCGVDKNSAGETES